MTARLNLIGKILIITSSIFTLSCFIPDIARAHCDTLEGPVVKEARAALEKGDITPVLKWVKKENEGEIKEAFMKTLAVRKQGKEAKELADMYFFETLVRIHRTGEGAPYTGLKPSEAIEPVIVESDRALESDSSDNLVKHVTDAVAKGIRENFAHAKETQKHADDNVGAGREYVEAYVVFTHYVERLYNDATAKVGHHGKAEAGEHPEEKEKSEKEQHAH
ncbi:MAG: hypothetical protein HY808_08155 [Nitrospirae bacterium]|nr:hypothetical protein [Nitrospirota bacterium]